MRARTVAPRIAKGIALGITLAVASVGCRDTAAAPIDVAVQVPADSGIMLAGVLSRPGGIARAPVAIMVSGSGPHDRDGARADLAGYRPFHDIALALTAEGIAVLRLDDRGTGASTGRFDGATTHDLARDVHAAMRWLRGRADVDGTRPVIVGHSEGAVVAMLVAADDPAVRALVLLGAPSRSGRELARWQRAQLVSSDLAEWPPSVRRTALARAEAAAESIATRDRWAREWFALDPRLVAERVARPALLVHGEHDRQVPPAQVEELAAALRVGAERATRAAGAGTGAAADVDVRRFRATDHLLLADHDGDPRGYARLEDRHVRAEITAAIASWVRAHVHPDVRPEVRR